MSVALKRFNGTGWDDTGFITATEASSTFAPLSHEHNASQISSGTLAVVRGGTGQSTIGTDGTYLKSNGTSFYYGGNYIDKKTYTGVYGSANNYVGAGFLFGEVTPDSWTTEWSVHYLMEVFVDGQSYYTSNHDCVISGARGVYTTYAFFNSISNTSYRSVYYHVLHDTTSDGFTAGYPHLLGASLQSSANPTSNSYPRTITVTILNTQNCTVVLKNSLVKYADLNSTYYLNANSNTAGNYNLLDASNNGLREVGDDNTYDRTYMGSNYLTNGDNIRINGYDLFGFSNDGKAQGLSVYSSTQTSATANISATRVFNNIGFNYKKGIWYTNTSANYAVSSSINFSPMFAITAIDLRYSDNCLSTMGTTLSLVERKAVYLRGVIGSDGLFYLAPIDVTYNSLTYQKIWTQDIPTSDDGYVYWLVGYPYGTSSYQIDLWPNNDLYWFKDGLFKPYENITTVVVDLISGDKILSGNNNYEYRYLYTSGISSLTFNSITSPSSNEEYNFTIIFYSPSDIATTIINTLGVYFTGDNCLNGVFTPIVSKKYTVLIYWNGVSWLGSVSNNSDNIIDLSDYYTKTETTNLLIGYVKTSRTINGYALTSDITLTKSDISLGNVENTALSTWIGSASITTLGAITTGSIPYSLITGTPIIPTVNDANLIIQKNGTDIVTFTANASEDVTANLIIPTKTSDLTNDSGFVTSSGVTSVGLSVPTGLSVSNTPINTSGTIALTLTSGYSIPTTADQTAWSNKQDALTFDTTPTNGSTNPVTSGGIYTSLSNYLPLTGGTLMSAYYPVLKIVRNQSTGTGAYASTMHYRPVNLNNSYVGEYFCTNDSDGNNTQGGFIAGGLSDATSGSEIGRIIIAPGYHGVDPYARTDMTITAIDASTSSVVIKGTLAVSNSSYSSSITPTSITEGSVLLSNKYYLASNPAGYTASAGTVTSVGATAGGGINITGSPITSSGSFIIANTGVLTVTEGTSNGTISINTGGTSADISVHGLGSNAYTSTAYSPLAGSSSLVTLGTIATGIWHGTAITDAYISSASVWNAKQNALTFDNTPTDGSLNPVTSNGIYDAIKTVSDLAEGKTNTYVCSYATNTILNSSNATITLSSTLTDTSGNVIALSTFKLGDVILITETDVPDRWVGLIASSGNSVSSVTLYKMETSKVDLNSFVSTTDTLTSGNLIIGGGNKTINISSFIPRTSSMTWDISSDINLPSMKAISNYIISKGYASGTVTSVGLSAPTGFSVSGSPISTSGTLAFSFASGYSLPTIANQTIWTNKQDALTFDSYPKYTSTNPVQSKGITTYIASRGENLVTNGTCLLGDNYNFTSLTYSGSDTYYAGGCFTYTGASTSKNSNEFIPVDVNQKYKLSYYIKSESATATYYDFLHMYDIDKNEIFARNVMFITGSTTTLAQDLNNGDTIVYLTDASGWNNTTTSSYQLGLIFWNYMNSFGYTYGVEQYSRNVFPGKFATGAVDKTANTITLSSAWTGGTFSSGTSVSQSSDGGTYLYLNAAYHVVADTWTYKEGFISGVGSNNIAGKFREGTAFITLGWLLNYSQSTSIQCKLSTISLAISMDSVYSTVSTGTKAYIVGSTSGSSTIGTLIKDTGVYLDTTAGNLHATAFTGTWNGDIIGNSYLPARLRALQSTSVTTDNIAECGFYYTSGSTSTANPFYSLHTSAPDFLVLSQNYSSSWATQIATDFRTNNIAVRNKNNGTWNSWNLLASSSDLPIAITNAEIDALFV